MLSILFSYPKHFKTGHLHDSESKRKWKFSVEKSHKTVYSEYMDLLKYQTLCIKDQNGFPSS